MEHTFKIEKELKITTENIVDCVLSCEAGGFDYWGELCSDEKDYEAARQRLAEREKADMKPCYEDVLAEILESGGKLTVYDREDDKDHELTLEKLLNGWKKYAEDHNADDFDEYDGISADCIIELQNIRDMVGMIYGQWFDKSRDQYLEDKKKGAQAVDKSAEYLDAMSAIICVIDYEKFKRGLGV